MSPRLEALADAAQLVFFCDDALLSALAKSVRALGGDEDAMRAAGIELLRCHKEQREARATLLRTLESFRADEGSLHG